jgi:hypothetical protein
VVVAAGIDRGFVIAMGAALLFSGVYYIRTTPAQRAAARARTQRIEGSHEWQRGPLLCGASVLVMMPGVLLRLPVWTLLVVGPISLALLIAGAASMIIAQRRHG